MEDSKLKSKIIQDKSQKESVQVFEKQKLKDSYLQSIKHTFLKKRKVWLIVLFFIVAGPVVFISLLNRNFHNSKFDLSLQGNKSKENIIIGPTVFGHEVIIDKDELQGYGAFVGLTPKNKSSPPDGYYSISGSDLYIGLLDNTAKIKLTKPFTIKIKSSKNLSDFNEDDVNIAYWDESKGEYVLLESTIDYEKQFVITEEAPNFGSYILFAKIKCSKYEPYVSQVNDLRVSTFDYMDFSIIWHFPKEVSIIMNPFQDGQGKYIEASVIVGNTTYYIENLLGYVGGAGSCPEGDELCLSQKSEKLESEWINFHDKQPTIWIISNINGAFGLRIEDFGNSLNVPKKEDIGPLLNNILVYKGPLEKSSTSNLTTLGMFNTLGKFNQNDIDVWKDILEKSSLSFVCKK